MLLADWIPDMIPPHPRPESKMRLQALAALVETIRTEEMLRREAKLRGQEQWR